MKEIVLASASPRRAQLLKQVGLQFRVMPSGIEEAFDSNLMPEQVVENLACKKAMDVADKLHDSALVIGADTIVVKGSILGKPENKTEACKMLKILSGQWHEVITGIAVVDSLSSKIVKSF